MIQPSGSPLGIEPRDSLSYVRGSVESPLSSDTVATLLANTGSCFSDRPAVVFREQNVRWTWAQFKSAVDHFAAGLASPGLQPVDRLGIWSPNRVQALAPELSSCEPDKLASRRLPLAPARDPDGRRAFVRHALLRRDSVPPRTLDGITRVARMPRPDQHPFHRRYPIPRLWRDAKLYETSARTSEIRRMLMGRELYFETM